MNQIPATTSTTTTTTTGTSSTSHSDPLLNKNAFLQLMMAQLSAQDPLNPSTSDPTQMVQELAQFTALEQQTNTAQSAAQTASAQQTSSAIALIGHTVSYVDSSGVSQSGTVQKVDLSPSGPTLTISGVTGINPVSVSEVS
jgi:flagellar basal-body rod modification protein FlgD